MRITTWNVNSIRQRQAHLLDFLREEAPDVVCLQELKTTLETLPRAEIEDAGYNVAAVGQKGFNGVALLSKHPIEDVREGLPGDESDSQARYVEGVIAADGGVVRVASIYLPNGNPVDSEKYPYKLAFMDRLVAHARSLLRLEETLVLAGDYNVIPEPRDAADPAAWEGDALYLPQTRAKFRALLALGLTDALRACDDAAGRYTFWDYQAGAWQRNKGIRIDHLLLSPQAADRLDGVTIHKHERAKEKPSDHVPVTVRLRG
ncbi:exodeoxyribonuclease III [Salinarimonas ramus]|uniref:Exodeoxyribonuclease III n=1 Tax=Salinarimonas ramus TaxID=690164 RepID=A0A917V788_9HYPH|nr:exodeoxyribonuclease III [Salinarimonas ramus]GGK46761.1 exodeoxyribonuclease III [Salinarimonas ramus]